MKKIFLAAAYAVFFIPILIHFFHPVSSGDFFHHLNSGKYIVSQRALPRHDQSSFTANGKPWIAHSWGSGFLYYFVYQQFGWKGVSVHFALLGLIAVLALFLLMRRLGAAPLLAMSLTWLATSMLSLYWPSRPLVLGPVLLAPLLFLLAQYPTAFWSLPFFFWLWAILNGSSSIVGLSILAAFLVLKKERHWRDALVLVLSVVASLLNGYGLESLFYVKHIPVLANPLEWSSILSLWGQHLLPSTRNNLIAYACLAICFFAALMGLIRDRAVLKKNLFFFLLSLGIFLPLISYRLLVLVPVLVIPMIGIALQSRRDLLRLTAPAICGVSCLLSGIRFSAQSVGLGLNEKTFPSSSVQFLKKFRINGRIYSRQDWGAFISWELPESKVFFDTRDELFLQTNVFRDEKLVIQGKLSFPKMLDDYSATIVIGEFSDVIYDSIFSSPQWAIGYADAEKFVAVRKSSVAIAAQPDPLIAWQKTLDLHPESYRTRLLLAEVFKQNGRLEEAMTAWRQVILADPKNRSALYSLANVLCARGRPQEAMGYYRRLLSDRRAYPGHQEFLSEVLRSVAGAWIQMGRPKEARRALALAADVISRQEGLRTKGP